VTTRTRRARLVPVLAAASVLALGACTSSAEIEEEANTSELTVNTSADQERVHSTPSDEAVALLPQGIVDDGTLTVAVGAFTAPLSFLADDNETVIGNETDIAQLVADGLGLDLDLVTTDWSNWPLATQSGAVDVTIANVTVTEERKELFDFSSYRVDNLGFLANAGSDLSITEPKDVAGLTIAVGSGTNQEKILLAWDEQNRAAGLQPVGRLDLSFGPNATAAYRAATAPDDFEVVGTVNGGWPETAQIAVATAKGNGLAEAITAALNHAIDNGSYTDVLERWGLTSESIEKSETNPPGLPRS
jgi:polar amino acid transport system substrate-binding protein